MVGRKEENFSWLGRWFPVLGITFLFLVIWILFWRLPVLMGDDRHFAIASNLSGGAQTAEGILKVIEDTWYLYNGRLADGLGPAYFALGNTAMRLIMAISYVLMAVLMWVWYRVSLPREIDADSKNHRWLELSLFAMMPFVLLGAHHQIAGESIFLAAAVWNYIIPLDLALLAFLPFLLRVCGRPAPVIWEVLAVPIIGVTMVMHEMVSIACCCLVLAGLWQLRRSWVDWRHLLVIVPTVYGMHLKVQAPGLWERADREEHSLETSGLEGLIDKLQRASGALSDYYTYYLPLTLLVVLAVILLTVRGAEQASRSRSLRIAGWSVPIILGVLILMSWRFRYAVARLAPDQLILLREISRPYQAAIMLLSVVLLGVVLLISYRRIPERCGPLPALVGTAFLGTLGVTALLARPEFGQLQRAGLAALLLLGFLGAILGAALLPDLRRRHLVAMLLGVHLFIGLEGGAFSMTQLLVNRAAWDEVELQVRQAQLGEITEILIPERLPCVDVTWYYWPPHVERTYEQLRIYYGLDSSVRFIPINPDRPCSLG